MSEGLRELRHVDDVLNNVKKYLRHRIKIEEIETIRAEGKICAEDVYARLDVPSFNRAAVDGYAVKSEDLISASPSSPVILKLVNKDAIESGEAREISTGEPLPEGADAVIMYEHTVRIEDKIEVYRPIPKWGNVSRKGEDFKKGDIIVKKGKLIDYIDIAALIATGNLYIKIYSPKIGLICTGDEIIDVEKYYESQEYQVSNHILNTTRFMLMYIFKNLGSIVNYYGIVKDNEDDIARIVLEALDENDVVVVTGGTAIGKRDATYNAIARLNPEFLWRGLAIRPAKPTGIAVIKGKPILMLSGFPVAAYVGFQVLGIPILYTMMGIEYRDTVKIKAKLTRRIAKPPNLRAYIRVNSCIDRETGIILARPLALTGSGLISTMIKGNSILEVPEELEGYEENSEIWITLVRDLKYCDEDI